MNQPLLHALVLALALPAGESLAASGDSVVSTEHLFVTMEVELPGAKPATVVAKNGGIAAYRNLAKGYSVGIIVRVVEPAAPADVELEVVEVTFDIDEKDFTVGETLGTALGRVGVESYVPVNNAALLEIAVRSIGGDPWEPLDVDSRPTLTPLREPACCLACGGTAVCGQTVVGACGACGTPL